MWSTVKALCSRSSNSSWRRWRRVYDLLRDEYKPSHSHLTWKESIYVKLKSQLGKLTKLDKVPRQMPSKSLSWPSWIKEVQAITENHLWDEVGNVKPTANGESRTDQTDTRRSRIQTSWEKLKPKPDRLTSIELETENVFTNQSKNGIKFQNSKSKAAWFVQVHATVRPIHTKRKAKQNLLDQIGD